MLDLKIINMIHIDRALPQPILSRLIVRRIDEWNTNKKSKKSKS